VYCIINIGSNLGDRRLNLSRAMRAVGMEFGDFEMSHAVEAKPEGFDSTRGEKKRVFFPPTRRFLNVSMLFQSDLEPQQVLERLQEIEKKISPAPHRNPDGSYRDRIIDIDIVAIDDMVIDTPTLKVPHPRLAERRFFLEPLKEIAPQWKHPASGLTARQMLAMLPPETEDEP